MQDDKTGLIDKYIVLKEEGEGPYDAEVTLHGDDDDGQAFGAFQKRTWCFVLSPEKDDAYGTASRRAMLQYAKDIGETNPELACDLREKVFDIQEKLREGSTKAP